MRQRPGIWMALGAGILLGVTGLAVLTATLVADPPLGRAATGALAVHLAAGREAGIPAALFGGLSWPAAFATALALEWTMLLIGFPLLVLLGARLHDLPWVRRHVARAESYAAKRPNAGVLLLGAVTLTPFLPIGALTSVLVGEVLRLPQARLVPVLMLAELLANLSVALAASAITGLFPDPRAPALALALLMLGLAIAMWWRERARASAPETSPPKTM